MLQTHTHSEYIILIAVSWQQWLRESASLLRYKYTGADKSLSRPDWKNNWNRHFSSNAEVIAAAETWLDGQTSELFLSGLQKLEFVRCSFFPSWSG